MLLLYENRKHTALSIGRYNIILYVISKVLNNCNSRIRVETSLSFIQKKKMEDESETWFRLRTQWLTADKAHATLVDTISTFLCRKKTSSNIMGNTTLNNISYIPHVHRSWVWPFLLAKFVSRNGTGGGGGGGGGGGPLFYLFFGR